MIFHIVNRSDWQQAVGRGQYAPPSLKTGGFVHASTLDQTLETANRFFRGQGDLVLLGIDEARLAATVKWEEPADPGDARRDQRFPHIYGPINLEAVVQVIDFTCESDFSFRLPPALRK